MIRAFVFKQETSQSAHVVALETTAIATIYGELIIYSTLVIR